ncbi:unnamed protein product [Adineta steineri]|uniref:Uncharacterized protein n=1 Tax=Adineta steineri TaxID=433720 RepID=A0A819P1J3_9BILA|nr:unnamed protein product [Adineta steineri]CAF1040017.1 unnamed protein product [Adineta steineri]CAF1172686.1 unnamed protein product [Adineta steineri]CAF1219272.1 unnamed protein product [Adineta steineri]CAF1336200.1 unnamed protein product [Adineta steineri]
MSGHGFNNYGDPNGMRERAYDNFIHQYMPAVVDSSVGDRLDDRLGSHCHPMQGSINGDVPVVGGGHHHQQLQQHHHHHHGGS